jgi:hypothetical protein
MHPFAIFCTFIRGVVFTVLVGTTAAVADDTVRPVRIRVQWGGGTPRSWLGQIRVTDDGSTPALHPPRSLDWHTLCREPDAAALAHGTPDGIAIHQPRPVANDGVELTIQDWPRARIRVQLGPTTTGETGIQADVAVLDLLDTPHQQPLDGDGNRLTIAAAPSEPLHVTLAQPEGSPAEAATAVHRPGDVLRFRVDPLIPLKSGVANVELRLRLSSARQDAAIDTQSTKLVPLPPPVGATPVGGRLPTPFTGVNFEVSLPAEEGVYEISLDAVELRGLRWTKSLASRVLQVVAIAPEPPTHDAAEWTAVYELDPGSPRLHERLRRLPARGLTAMPLPAVALPAMPLPSLSRQSLSLPRLPEVPVPLPDVSAMVPRLGGLLASGHSVVTPHPLGPMLRLPPAADSQRPAWEAITIAAAREGRPHLIEVDYPTAQRATVAICILEPDSAGARVEVRHAGGFAVDDRQDPGEARIATHRFVFWPTCRNPVVVLANPHTTSEALVGRVRVFAGPERLSPASASPANPAGHEIGHRPTYALLPDPDLPGLAGGPGRAASGGRASVDWLTHFSAIRHTAEAVSAQGLAGSVATVFADGAAAWPSALTRSAPRWNAASDMPLDPVPKDILMALAWVYDREGLSLIPALRFDAALPALEAELTGNGPAGIVCVGSDGRPRALPGGPHYNILDPRVQQAVEMVVSELASRLRATRNVTGIAIELPHEGWLHLPGVEWGLDDQTFDSFLTAIGEAPPPPSGRSERFAERAQLVLGPLRQDWLNWRTEQLAAFYARLTAIVAGRDGRWPLYVVPTTMFADGDLTRRFRPQAGAGGESADLLREVGLVATLPEGIAHGGRLVFMSPQVCFGGADLATRAVIAAANGSFALAQAAASARERGVAILPRPLSLSLADVVPHGPFGSAAAGERAQVRIVSQQQAGDRELASALMAADASIVFDMRPMLVAAREPSRSRRAREALPTGSLRLVDDLPAPLVVRSLTTGDQTWLEVANLAHAPATAVVRLGGKPTAALDAVDGQTLVAEGGDIRVPLASWDVRAIVIEGTRQVEAATVEYDPEIVAATGQHIERLRQRLGVLHSPQPLEVLDNPGFELGLAAPAGAAGQPAITGWELLEPRRGSLGLVPGVLPATDSDGARKSGRGLEFTSFNGLSTLRSNPFPPPKTGRISAAAWLRIKPGDQQPPLRIAVEGVEDGREYYRFAPIGGLTGGRALTAEWSLFVLQVDALPTGTVDSLRVRFDLLGPGSVQVDDVCVYDLAFDEAERTSLAKEIARIDHLFKQGDLGGALIGLAGHWPAFLENFVSDAAVAARARLQIAPAAAEPPAEKRQGTLDRFRGWWQ